MTAVSSLGRVLIVEDEAILARDLAFMLADLGWEVVGVASSAEAAIRLALGLAPDLVLMDIRLDGGSDGIEAAARIHDRLDLPIVFMTAHNDEITLSRARETHPRGFLFKPYQEFDLKMALDQAERAGGGA